MKDSDIIELQQLEQNLDALYSIKEYRKSEFDKEEKKIKKLVIAGRILNWGLPSLVLITSNVAYCKIMDWNPFKLNTKYKEEYSYVKTVVDEEGNTSESVIDQESNDILTFHSDWYRDENDNYVSKNYVFKEKELTIGEVNNLNFIDNLTINDLNNYGMPDYTNEIKLTEIDAETLEKGSYVTAIICDSNGFDVVETKEYWWEHFGKFILFLGTNGALAAIIFFVNADIELFGYDFKNSKQKEYYDAKNEFEKKETEYKEKIKKLGLSDSYIAKEY